MLADADFRMLQFDEEAALVKVRVLEQVLVGGQDRRRSITAGRIATGQLKTSNYAEDGSGNPTAGAKLDHTGTALKIAPGNLQIGSRFFSQFFTSGNKDNTAGQDMEGPQAGLSVWRTPMGLDYVEGAIYHNTTRSAPTSRGSRAPGTRTRTSRSWWPRRGAAGARTES